MLNFIDLELRGKVGLKTSILELIQTVIETLILLRLAGAVVLNP